jgi:phage head maturation protease
VQDPAQVQAHWGPPLSPRRPLALPAGPARFDAAPAFVFATAEFAGATEAPKVDQASRTITGLALPYNAVARKYGVGFRFKPGSLEYSDVSRLKALKDHGTAVGFHQEASDGRGGMSVKLKILDGPEGSPAKLERDQLLYDAQNGLYDGLSVGVDFDLMTDATWNEDDQVFDVHRASWRETSITPLPAFDDARVTSVAASRTGAPMNCQHCGRAHPAGMSCQTYAQLNPQQQQAAGPQTFTIGTASYGVPAPGWSPMPQNGQQPAQYGYGVPAQPAQPGPVAQQVLQNASTTDALTAALSAYVTDAISAGQVAPVPPAVDPGQQFAQQVNPLYDRGRGNAHVIEPDPYRIGFDRRTGDAVLHRGTHDFSADLHAALTLSDKGANDRALKFIQDRMVAAFNVATTDVDELNPARQRPDMYVDQRQYRYPMWSAVNKGALTDITPFKFPKFNSASGLVAAHTEGTEPSTGSFTTTGQTVTPSAYSGKARINREVWDQGGNPQLSTLIWNQMVRGVNEALEAAVVTLLNAGSYTSLATLTAGATDRAAAGALLGNELSGGFAALQFARGGFFITDVFGQADLYLTLLKATDDAGRPLYPMLGPSNANGTTGNRFGEIDLGGVTIDPAWALAAAGQTAATKSYAIDRQSVHGWASAPQRITMDAIAVATVDIGVWGYQATAVSDDNGVRTISWDPVA